MDEFRLVQAAFETLRDPDRRRAYDSGSIGGGPASHLIVPDVIGVDLSAAAELLNTHQFAFQVAAFEVPAGSPLAGLVIGQYPYPGDSTDTPLVGLFVGISEASSVWERLSRAAAEFGSGFAQSFWSELTLAPTGARPQLSSGQMSARDAGQRSGEFVGDVVNTGGQLLVAYSGLIFFAMWALLVFVLLAFVPVLGLIFAGLWIWAFVKFWKGLRSRRRVILDRRTQRRSH